MVDNKPSSSRSPNEIPSPPSSPSLPTPTSNGQCSAKPKGRPTVTPRTFTRFFTPRSFLGRGEKIGASRQALREITAYTSNRKRLSHQRSSTRGTVQAFGDENDEFEVERASKKRKRDIPPSPDTSPVQSSPLKRKQTPSITILDDPEDETILSDVDSIDGDSGKETAFHARKPGAIKPIQSRCNGRMGWNLRRDTGRIDRPRVARDVSYGSDWQTETSNFFADSEDTHLCEDVVNSDQSSIPFCTTSCNTNSLIAIGDEEGGIRLLESAKNSEPEFSEAYLTFRPHTNAILDLAFSPDDLLLVTASGDQTSQVIDMPTQRTINTLAGHVSSVKQIRFQPGSSNVMATSSRDGSVQIWDLRCKAYLPARNIKVSLEPSNNETPSGARATHKMTYASFVNTISDAHSGRATVPEILTTSKMPRLAKDSPWTTEHTTRRGGDVSVTALTFLPQGREHLLLTASEANANVKLWDIRISHTQRRRSRDAPLSTSRQPDSHTYHRQFGLTSISLSGDAARLYTLCRDNTVYVYSTSHLILGHAPELSSSSFQSHRANRAEKPGLGPLYGLRHPKFHATTFYVKSALRPAANNKSEVLAVGSGDSCAVLFPTDERYLQPGSAHSNLPSLSPLPFPDTGPTVPLYRMDSGSALAARLNDTIPIYQHGSALIRGHDREVTGLTWTKGGDLVSLGDDCTARCWREGRGSEARSLRVGGEGEGRRWGCGWAEAKDGFDDEDG
ncbi:hypothetical protein MMC07_006365 [Pseudocyphellaria aurata]|nr:hypothetical protein [Pseudocyphellaria aurata]